MSRPRSICKISCCIPNRRFRPEGASKDAVRIGPEEVEALYLKHEKGLDQTAAAKKMEISQSTFQRLLSSAHRKMTKALIENSIIEI